MGGDAGYRRSKGWGCRGCKWLDCRGSNGWRCKGVRQERSGVAGEAR